MSTSKAKGPNGKRSGKNDKLTTLGGEKVDVAEVADHAAAEALAPRKLIVETEWFELNGFRVKAVQVSPSVYQVARSHLRALMRKNAPQPPMQKGPDGKMKPNPLTKAHRKAMEEWEDLYQDLDEDLFFSVAVLAGLHIHPDDLKMVEDFGDGWLNVVENQLKSIGVDLSITAEQIMYNGDPDTLNMLLFKKHVLLSDPQTFKAFMEFQKQPTKQGVPVELLTRYSADMFRPEKDGSGS